MKELRKLKKVTGRLQIVLGMLVLVFALAMFGDGFSMVSHAESQGKVTAATNAKIRKEASTSSESLGSAKKDSTVTILSEVQGADGYKWYQVIANDNITGYIRSDLIQVVETEVTVEKLNPVSGTVTGETVNVRKSATTNSDVVKSVTQGTVLTITGRANGSSDGKVWYWVNFSADNGQVEGFIRSDFVQVAGDLTPYTEPTAPTAEPPVQSQTTPEPATATQEPVQQEEAPYYVAQQDGKWYVVKTETNEGWEISTLLNGSNSGTEDVGELQKTVKSQKAVIIVLVLFVVAAVAAVAYLLYRIKDMNESAYFKEVEAETIRRRNAAETQNGKRVMVTVGEDKKAGNSQGAKPQGAGQGAKPQGQRPQGSAQGQRPQAGTQGQRPQGSAQGQRPQAGTQGQRPQAGTQGQRPQGSAQGQRPQAGTQGQRPQGNAQGQRPAPSSQSAKAVPAPDSQDMKAKNAQQAQPKQTRNFMVDEDDEFEFEFLNYDGDEEQ